METLTYREPRVVALVLLVLVAAGLSALLSIGRQEDPSITNLTAVVTTVYPGADPERVETLVTVEIERELRTIAEVDKIESTSATSVSIVQIRLNETIRSSRIEQVWSEIRDKLEDARKNFPEGVVNPEFDSDTAGAYAALIAIVPRHDQLPMSILGRHGKELADRLRGIPGTKLADSFGEPIEEVLVKLDPTVSAALGITTDQVSAAIRTADSKVQAGRLHANEMDLLINVEGAIESLDRVRRVVIRTGIDGQILHLGDIAEIERGVRQPAPAYALANGRPAVLLAAKINDGLQIGVWMDRVKQTLLEFQSQLPASVKAELVFDQSAYTAKRLTEVGVNMLIGTALIIIVLLLTLGMRAATLIALMLPLVSLATLATMNVIGLPIHQMSVIGIIVALGLLVDSAIVMTDEIRQRLLSGFDGQTAVSLSVRRLWAPLSASTVTTALAFTPMILLPGPPGDFVGAVAMAVVIMLTWSLLVALTITPALAGWLLPKGPSRSFMRSGFRSGWAGTWFRNSLDWSIRHPSKSISLALVLPFMGFASFTSLPAQFFPGVDRDQFHIEVETANGTAIGHTLGITREIDELLRRTNGIEQVNWVIGKSAPAFYYNIVGFRDHPEFSHALITTASAQTTESLLRSLQKELTNTFPEARILVRGLVQGPPVKAPVEFRLVGPDLDTLRALGEAARAIILRLEPVTLVRTSLKGGAPKIQIDIDEGAAHLLGLDLSAIARQLQSGLEGVVGGSLIEATEQIPVRVRLGEDVRANLTRIANLPIIPPNAKETVERGDFAAVPLSTLAEISLRPAPSTISRLDAERINTVQVFLQQGVLPEEALQMAKSSLDAADFTLPPGYRLEVGGDSDARGDTIANLLSSLGIIVALSIATIVLTLNSFRFSAITFGVAVLSAGLSLLSLALFSYPFGITAIIGVTGSIGVSINTTLIILTALKDDAAACSGNRDAVVNVVMRTSRHVLSTTATTFGGFLPLILSGGGFWPPFAMSIAGGVLLSSVVSFYFTPPMFLLVSKRARGNYSAVDRTPGNPVSV